jgi:hypothetical protein
MKVDIDQSIKALEEDVKRHNEIFLFKFADRIKAIRERNEKLGITNYKMPITEDSDGRFMWVNRKARRKMGFA